MNPSKNAILEKTFAFLHANPEIVGNTMLMPLNKKTPLFKHAAIPWTWELYEDFRRDNKKHISYGLLLDTLIAIDADSIESIEYLEKTFPETLVCPAQDTAHGRHYIFHRPAWADERGFFDGARQNGKEGLPIDVKTICHTGSRGVLSVEPSISKQWVAGRELWSVPVIDPSIKLLEAICKPRPKTSSVPKKGKKEKQEESSVSTSQSLKHDSFLEEDAKRFLARLARSRADSWASWMDVGFALHNISTSLLHDWIDFSRQSSKFVEGECQKKWETMESRSNGFGLLSLKNWASLDAKVLFLSSSKIRLAPTELNDVILSNWDVKDIGLAVIAHDILKDYIKVCGKGQRSQVYYFCFDDVIWRIGNSKSVRFLFHIALKQALQLLLPYFKTSDSSSASTASTGTRVKSEYDRVLMLVDYVSTASGLNLITDLAIDRFQDDSFFNKLDSVPHLLGVKNGVIDLRDGKLRGRLPEDMLFTIINVAYDEMADTSLIEKTVLEAMGDDLEMAIFIRKLLGYGITAEVCEQILAFFTGCGGNCKGILMKVIETVMDTFFKKAHLGLITHRTMANPEAERGSLQGARLVLFNELDEKDKLKMADIQMLTGGDTIPGAFFSFASSYQTNLLKCLGTPKYKDPMKVEPRFLCMITTNHIPIFGPVFAANLRRFMCIDFPVSFVDLQPGEVNSATRKQKDNTLAGRLAADLPGVLRWLVMGAIDWYAHGNLMRDCPEKSRWPQRGTCRIRIYSVSSSRTSARSVETSPCRRSPSVRLSKRRMMRWPMFPRSRPMS